jgi:hypothetical protein
LQVKPNLTIHKKSDEVSHVRLNPIILKLGQNKSDPEELFLKHFDLKGDPLYQTDIRNHVPFHSNQNKVDLMRHNLNSDQIQNFKVQTKYIKFDRELSFKTNNLNGIMLIYLALP